MGRRVVTAAPGHRPAIPKPDTAKTLATCDGTEGYGTIIERDGVFISYDASGALVGKYSTQREAMRAIPTLTKQGDAILKRARYDATTGAKIDKKYRRDKRAESKRLGRHWREKKWKLGKLGPASPVKHVEVGKN
jgi:hypothetical protein